MFETQRDVPRVVGLMGSYRCGGAIDSAVAAVLAEAQGAGASICKIDLNDRHVEHCRNCRACMQAPGSERGVCVIEDDVAAILEQLEAADAIVLGSSVNFGDVNALTRKLLERMAGFAYWPNGSRRPPTLRRLPARGRAKPAVVITSSAAPAGLTRIARSPLRTLRRMANLLGFRPIAAQVVGMVVGGQDCHDDAVRGARRLGRRLVGALGLGSSARARRVRS